MGSEMMFWYTENESDLKPVIITWHGISSFYRNKNQNFTFAKHL